MADQYADARNLHAYYWRQIGAHEAYQRLGLTQPRRPSVADFAADHAAGQAAYEAHVAACRLATK